MNRNLLPKNAFIDPTGENAHEVKALIDSFTELVLSHAATSSLRQPLPNRQHMSFADIPEHGCSEQIILENLRHILELSMNPSHSGYIGHMDSIPTLMSCLGEFVSSTVNNNMLSLEMSPIFSQMEVQIIQKIAILFGFGQEAGGVLLSGGTLANLQALAVARNNAFSVLRDGLTQLSFQPVLFASEAAHTSIQKAVMLLGLGTSSVIPVKTNENSQMDVTDLENNINQAFAEGKKPFCIIATAGTTVTGNIDPLPQIAELAKKFGLWLHVDAAYGGALIFSQRHRHRLKGIEQADSVTFNPQKWLYVAKTCAMVIFRDRNILQTDFRISVPYMNDTNGFTNLGEISVQGTRHAEILKLWLSLHHLGMKGFEQLINESYELVDYFAEQVSSRPYLQIASTPDTNLCSFRGTPMRIPAGQWDNWNLALQQHLLQKGQIFFSFPTYRGNRWLRAVLLNPFTSKRTIKQAFEEIDQFYLEIGKYLDFSTRIKL